MVHLNDLFNIYFGSVNSQRYKLQHAVRYAKPVDFLAIAYQSLFIAHRERLTLLTFKGGLEREWTFEAPVACLHFLGGPQKKEAVLIGLQNGLVYKVFSENPFPILLLRQSHAVRQLSLSCDFRKLAVVIL